MDQKVLQLEQAQAEKDTELEEKLVGLDVAPLMWHRGTRERGDSGRGRIQQTCQRL